MKTKKIICLENLPFRSNIRVGSHHYAELFSREYDVLWISLPWHLPQLIKYPRNDRYISWGYGRPSTINDNLRTLVPFTLIPYRNHNFLNSNFILTHYYSFMLPRIRSVLRKLDFLKIDLLWFSDPRHISILRYVNYSQIAYRCVDNLEHFLDIPKKLITFEIGLIKKCDAVFYTSAQLLKKYGRFNKKSFLLPNGVDYKLFSDVHPPSALNNNFPKGINRHKERNVIYVGTIAEWLDIDVILKLSQFFPDFNFFLVGPVRTQLPYKVHKRPNVTFTGPMPYSSLPKLLSCCSIGLIPFKVSSLTDDVSPIKLFEYFAAGLVVLSSNMKTVKNLASPALIYNDFDLIQTFTRAAKLTADQGYIDKIMAYAEANSWEERFKIIKGVLGG